MIPQNPYKKPHSRERHQLDIIEWAELWSEQVWQEGFNCCWKYLNEPCAEHPECESWHINDSPHDDSCYPLHRYLCSECIKELEGK